MVIFLLTTTRVKFHIVLMLFKTRNALARDIFLYFVDEVFCDDLPQARVELLPMFVEHHSIGVPVQLLKAESAVVLPLYLLDGIL